MSLHLVNVNNLYQLDTPQKHLIQNGLALCLVVFSGQIFFARLLLDCALYREIDIDNEPFKRQNDC
jgi:hypothetical protein